MMRSRRLLLAWVLLTAISGRPALGQSPPGDRRPNFLLITIDTLRADRLGSYGYSKAETPVLDRLAREAVQFENAFTPVPLTLPAHASILTGTYPSYHGIRDNSGFVLSPEQRTLAEMLKASGYTTAAFVGAFVLDSRFGLDQGFDHYYDDFDLTQFENVSPGYIQRTGDVVVKRALDWLKQASDAPFFVWLHLYDPHDPYTPPQPYASRHPGRAYDGEIAFTDANIGHAFDWLKKAGVYDNTLIVVVGDHGESLGEHGEDKHGFFIYNSVLRVPLLIRLPAGENGGKKITQNVSTIDLFVTVAQILRLDRSVQSTVQGAGLLSLILGKGEGYRRDLYAETYYPRLQFGWSELRAIIAGPHKYILAPKPELYDWTRDPGEAQNLFEANQSLGNRLRENLKNMRARIEQAATAKQSEARLDAETVEKLRSLGYVAVSMGNAGTDDFQALPDPKDQVGTYREIVDLFELSSRGRYEAVIPRYRELLRKQPGLKLVRYKLGQAYFHTGDHAAALEQFKQAIALGGDAALATYDLALTYLKLERIDDAILGFQRTVELDSSHYRALTNLGVLYKNQGKVVEAIAALEKALSIAPNAVYALGNLGVAYSLAGQHERGVETLKRAIALAPEQALLYANLGVIYRRMGLLWEADQQFEKARSLNPNLFRE